MNFPEAQYLNAFDEYGDAVFRYWYYHFLDRRQAKEMTEKTYQRLWDVLKVGQPVYDARIFLYHEAHRLAQALKEIPSLAI